MSAWAGEQMAAHHALIFIGACGIAVRAIAPWIMDKLHDSPVLVADEMGKYVIPLLSCSERRLSAHLRGEQQSKDRSQKDGEKRLRSGDPA